MTLWFLTDWLKKTEPSAREKALFASAALTFFCLSLGTSPSTIAGALTASVWLFSGIAMKQRRIYIQPYWWPVFGMILLPWIGMMYTHDKTGIGIDYAGKVYYWLLGFSVAGLSFKHFPYVRLIQAFMLGLGVNVIAAIVQMVFHIKGKSNSYDGLGPGYGTLSAYLIVGIMMGIFFLNRERRTRFRIAIIALIGLYFFHFVILKSRANYVAFVLLVPLMGYTLFGPKKLLKTILICLIVPCLMLLSPIVRERLKLTVNQFKYHLYTDDEAAWGRKYSVQQDRFYMWYGALKIIKENPVFGVGTGGYQTVLKGNDSDPNAPLIAHPHNNFLYMAVSYGILGVAVFSWFLYVTIVSGWRQRETAEGYFLLSVILVMVTSGLFNTQILDVGTAFLISLSVGLQSRFQASVS